MIDQIMQQRNQATKDRQLKKMLEWVKESEDKQAAVGTQLVGT